MTFEKVKELYETDKLNMSMLPYVKPLLDRIKELEDELNDLNLQMLEDDEMSCLE